eukprot:1160219-Pelagomonas_calceolata.AAC.5
MLSQGLPHAAADGCAQRAGGHPGTNACACRPSKILLSHRNYRAPEAGECMQLARGCVGSVQHGAVCRRPCGRSVSSTCAGCRRPSRHGLGDWGSSACAAKWQNSLRERMTGSKRFAPTQGAVLPYCECQVGACTHTHTHARTRAHPPVTILRGDNVGLVTICLIHHVLYILQGQDFLEWQLLDGVLELDLKHIKDALTTCGHAQAQRVQVHTSRSVFLGAA